MAAKKTKKKSAHAGKQKEIKQVSKTFRAPLERMSGNLGWTIIYLPFQVHEIWGKRGQVKVRGEVNGFPFRTSAFPTKRGVHFVMVNKQMQKGGKVVAGSTAEFRMEPDTEERVVVEPKELLNLLKEDKGLAKWYQEKLSYSAKREIAKWVSDSKQAETRQRRAGQMAERLMSAMEAERELPPLIRRMMDQTPKSYAGWEKMTPAQRRYLLLAIFYYRSPEAQQRRIAKAIDVMLEKAER